MDAQKLTDAEIDLIANDGMRNAAGGIYSTRVHEFARSVEAAVRDALQAELASMTRMFHAACADLGEINDVLGLDPEDGGAEPIIGAIEELKAQIAALAPSDAAQAPKAVAWECASPAGEKPMLAFLTSKEPTREHYESQGWRVTPLYLAAPVAPAAAAPITGMERAFSSSSMGRRDEMALLNLHAETPRLLALLGLPLIDAISLYDVRIRLENALTATEAEAAEDAYVAQRMTQLLAEVYATIIGEDARPEDEGLPVVERVKKAAQVMRLEIDLYRAQRDEADTLNGTLLREAFEFTCYVAAAFCSDKQRHRDVDGNVYYIQPTTEDWWDGLRDDLEALQPKLKDALRAPQGAAQ